MRKIAYILLVFFFVSCSFSPQIQSERAVFFLIKSPKLRYADNGFIKHFGDEIHVDLFNSAQKVLELSIAKQICLNWTCLSKKEFNDRFLHSSYPEDFLEKLLLKKEDLVFNRRKKEEILYNITEKKSIFKDKKYHIFVKILEL